jgi:hypothetical protein
MKSLHHNQNRVPRTESEIRNPIVIVARKLDWFYAIE